MTVRHRTSRWHAFSSAWILAALIGIVMLGEPRVVAAQTGSVDVCDAAHNFAAVDAKVESAATSSYDEQVAVQEAWHAALAALAEQLPAGEVRSAAETLHGAQTVVSDEEWTEEQSNAYEILSKDLARRCNIQLNR